MPGSSRESDEETHGLLQDHNDYGSLTDLAHVQPNEAGKLVTTSGWIVPAGSALDGSTFLTGEDVGECSYVVDSAFLLITAARQGESFDNSPTAQRQLGD